MKSLFALLTFVVFSSIAFHSYAQSGVSHTIIPKTAKENLYIDVHHLEPGNVTYEAVAAAHAKDLATEGKYGVQFLKFWVDEGKGLVYCLSSASDSESIRKTHAEAHGLLPDHIYQVTDGAVSA